MSMGSRKKKKVSSQPAQVALLLSSLMPGITAPRMITFQRKRGVSPMKIQRISTMFLLCASLVLASSALAQSEDPTLSPSPSSLTLLNGWTNAPYSTSDAQVEKINGIVHLK